MKYRIINTIICLLLIAAVSSCEYTTTESGIYIVENTKESPDIFPDYEGVTVPVNIAPLNFHIENYQDAPHAAVFNSTQYEYTIMADADGDIVIPENKWRELAGDSFGDITAEPGITVTVCRQDSAGWVAYKPFQIVVAPTPIDQTLVYRLIEPLYGTWRHMGIYQRNLETYDETPIYENAAHHGNCVNCHSFAARNPDRMQLHLRGDGGGTYILKNGDLQRLDTKTDSTIANFTYPYWHPGGRYIAYSVNNIFQVFHTSDPNRAEVIDDASDIVVYDTATGKAFSSPLIKRADRLETFPAFSADGDKLFFCSAEIPDSLPEKYKEVRYGIYSIDFNAATGTFGEEVDTLYDTKYPIWGSMTCPRPSPDGRYLVATHTAYGQFPIWHKDADLWFYDLETGKWEFHKRINSPDVESYHSWSSDSQWLVFSSRRIDGLYTRPYIAYVDHGVPCRPFLLPQKHPKKYYTEQMKSYNIPELVDGKVNIGTLDIVDAIGQTPKKVTWK